MPRPEFFADEEASSGRKLVTGLSTQMVEPEFHTDGQWLIPDEEARERETWLGGEMPEEQAQLEEALYGEPSAPARKLNGGQAHLVSVYDRTAERLEEASYEPDYNSVWILNDTDAWLQVWWEQGGCPGKRPLFPPGHLDRFFFKKYQLNCLNFRHVIMKPHHFDPAYRHVWEKDLHNKGMKGEPEWTTTGCKFPKDPSLENRRFTECHFKDYKDQVKTENMPIKRLAVSGDSQYVSDDPAKALRVSTLRLKKVLPAGGEKLTYNDLRYMRVQTLPPSQFDQYGHRYIEPQHSYCENENPDGEHLGTWVDEGDGATGHPGVHKNRHKFFPINYSKAFSTSPWPDPKGWWPTSTTRLAVRLAQFYNINNPYHVWGRFKTTTTSIPSTLQEDGSRLRTLRTSTTQTTTVMGWIAQMEYIQRLRHKMGIDNKPQAELINLRREGYMTCYWDPSLPGEGNTYGAFGQGSAIEKFIPRNRSNDAVECVVVLGTYFISVMLIRMKKFNSLQKSAVSLGEPLLALGP